MNPSSGKQLFIQASDMQEDIWQKMQQEFARAVHDKKHPFRLAILGSQKSKGIGMRYLVLRELTPRGGMLFYTDSRGSKVAELKQNPACSLLFYHPQKGLQIRIEGMIQVHQRDELCKEHWKRVQGLGRRAYTPLIQPGKIIENPFQAHKWPEEMTDDYFSILGFVPESFDLLQLNRLEHLRVGFKKREEAWEMNWLAP